MVTIRNDEKSVDEIMAMKPDGIVISPGLAPYEAGICIDLIVLRSDPDDGVCLLSIWALPWAVH